MQLLEAARAARVVDQDVHAAETGHRRVGDAAGGVVGVHVLFDQHRLGATGGHDLGGDFTQFLDAARGDRHAHAFGGQGFGDAAADADAGAGDEGGAPGELQVHLFSVQVIQCLMAATVRSASCRAKTSASEDLFTIREQTMDTGHGGTT